MAPVAIQDLVGNGTLTPRQGEVAELLAQGHKAREIAGMLGITRNAVYSQINAIKKKGVLGTTYTPSGEVRTPPAARSGPSSAAEILDHIVPVQSIPASEPAHMDVIRELVNQNRMLLEMLERLSKTS